PNALPSTAPVCLGAASRPSDGLVAATGPGDLRADRSDAAAGGRAGARAGRAAHGRAAAPLPGGYAPGHASGGTAGGLPASGRRDRGRRGCDVDDAERDAGGMVVPSDAGRVGRASGARCRDAAGGRDPVGRIGRHGSCRPFLMFTQQEHSIEKMTAVWLIPVVAAEVTAASAGLLVPHLVDPAAAFRMLILGYALWAFSVPLAMSILVILVLRLVLHKLPHRDMAASGWLSLGPLGTGALGLLLLGAAAPSQGQRMRLTF
ncbi:MAG: hypothetical protein EON55_04640, partial [Alphaproteobacteria bacterium]